MTDGDPRASDRSNGFLLDTHVLFFLDTDPEGLFPGSVLAQLSSPDATLFVSSLTPWEMSIKFHAGKWPAVGPLLADLAATLLAYRCTDLAWQSNAALAAGALPALHRDPFDRGLIGQAAVHRLELVSADPLVHRYVGAVPGLRVLWA